MVSTDGRRIKEGLLIRSAFLRMLDEEQIEYLDSLNIKYILDLRSTEEAESKQDEYFPEGVKYYNISASVPRDAKVFGELSREQKKDMQQLVAYAVLPFNNKAYKKAFELIKNCEGPLLFHCYAGKDRTGVLAALILILLDVNYLQIFNDYMLSIRSMKLMYGSSTLPVAWQVREEWLEASLNAILLKYGSYDRYFEAEYGIDKTVKEKIKDYYLL